VAAPVTSTEVSTETYLECVAFLNLEAELLDDNRIRDWFALIAEDIDYRVPIRVTRERFAGPGFSSEGYHMLEDHGSLETRVLRLETEYAWAEDPPSRTRRMVSNIRVTPGEPSDELNAKSNLMVYRGRYDASAHQLIVGERQDILRRTDDGLKLRKRLVLLDQSTLGTHNLAIFL
jgi:3-phenylpropionate/cinnamic acid dioxygenase small subunit